MKIDRHFDWLCALTAVLTIIFFVVTDLTQHGWAADAVVKDGKIFYLGHSVYREVSWNAFLISVVSFSTIGCMWLGCGILKFLGEKKKGWFLLSAGGIVVVFFNAYKCWTIWKAL